MKKLPLLFLALVACSGEDFEPKPVSAPDAATPDAEQLPTECCYHEACGDPVVRQCVCAIDDWCCANWDASCAAFAAVNGCVECVG